MADIDIVHIPYKGFGQGINDVMAGHVPLIFGGITAAIQLSKSGKLKPIAVTSLKRSKALPDVPAIAETLPGFRIDAWYGFIGPAGMPKDLVKKINADVADGMEVVSNSPDEFAVQIAEDLREWHKLIQSARIQLD